MKKCECAEPEPVECLDQQCGGMGCLRCGGLIDRDQCPCDKGAQCDAKMAVELRRLL